MRFTLDQIDVFISAVEAGSFSAAARRLGRAQSSVSDAVANLEESFGTALFDRTKRSPVLTEAGETLLRESRDLLDRALTLESHADSLAQGNPTKVTMAIDIPYHFAMEPLRDFAARYPHVDVDLRNPSNGDVPQFILDGHAALGISFAQPQYSQELEFAALGELVLCHVAHRTHPLAQEPSITLSMLQGYRHLAHIKHSRVLPTTEYLQSTQKWHAEDYAALTTMVRNRLGWATVPRQLVLDELESGEFVELMLVPYPHTDYWVYVNLLWKRAEPQPEAVRWLRERMRRQPVFEGIIGPSHEGTRDGRDAWSGGHAIHRKDQPKWNADEARIRKSGPHDWGE